MCELDGRFIKPCESMQKTFDHQKGVRLVNLADRNTMELTSDRIVMKTGEFRKRGVALNFCPFTGKSIETWN